MAYRDWDPSDVCEDYLGFQCVILFSQWFNDIEVKAMSDKMQTLGKYQLLEKIGEGGFGVVYRARDPLLERDVAIKVLRADLASAPDFVERFRREARLAASLRHPNIVTVIEVGEQDGRYYLVMDDLPGVSLKNDP